MEKTALGKGPGGQNNTLQALLDLAHEQGVDLNAPADQSTAPTSAPSPAFPVRTHPAVNVSPLPAKKPEAVPVPSNKIAKYVALAGCGIALACGAATACGGLGYVVLQYLSRGPR